MRLKRLFFLLFVCSQLSPIGSKELEIFVGSQARRVDWKENQGQIYYDLRDLVKILELSFQERGSELILSGRRGRLVLSEGRPLVRLEDQYILLSAPLWMRNQRNWYVPEDLFTKALPLILSQKLEKLGARRYRVETMGINLVEVRLANHPDQVRIVFRPSQKTPMRVKEFANYIRVEFSDYLVRPILPKTQPDQRMVSSLEFDSMDVYGAFLVHKGDRYHQFRQFTLLDPDRKVVDVYAPSAAGTRDATETSGTFPPLPTEVLPSWVEDLPPEQLLVFQPRLPQNTIAIDPGHGGGDYGVQPSQEVSEKSFTLEIADQIRQHLEGSGYLGLLTRSRDVELSAAQRSSVANHYRSKANISIHAGGSPTPETSGPVVYVQRYPEVQSVQVKAEVGLSSETVADGGSRLVSWEEGQKKYLEESRQLAELIQGELNTLYGIHNEVVEVSLAVLAPVMAPAVLIESGFLTNLEESQKLIQPDFQDEIVSAIVTAVLRFLK